MIQGEFRVSDRHDVVLATVLGSCVSLCITDPKMGIGGMNHFLLPGVETNKDVGIRHGVMAMELLLNGVLKKGATRSRLQAKLFGGAVLNANLARIGEQNSKFAEGFLEREGITCVSKSLGGQHARKIRFVPATGEAQQMKLKKYKEEVDTKLQRTPSADDGVTFFQDLVK